MDLLNYFKINRKKIKFENINYKNENENENVTELKETLISLNNKL